MWKLTFADRLACALLGALFGAIYGILLAVVVAWVTDGLFRSEYLWYGGAVFAAIGFVTGPFVGDVIGDLIHVVCGLFVGILSILSGPAIAYAEPEPWASGWPRTLFLLGFGTGLIMFLVWRVS